MRGRILVGALVVALVGLSAPARTGATTWPAPQARQPVPFQPPRPDTKVLPPRTGTAAGAPTSSKPIAGAPGNPTVKPESVPGELIVTFKHGTSTASRRSTALDVKGTLSSEIPDHNAAIVKVVPKDATAAAAALRRDPRVEAVDPNYIRRALDTVPTDPQYGAQADYLRLMRASRAWDRTRGDSTTVVAVLDTGIDLDHPDLKPNILSAEAMVPGGAGDPDGHGTAVAGVIAAVANNGIGISGIAPRVKIRSIRVLHPAPNEYGSIGTDGDVALAIDRARALHVDVINMSFGAPGRSSFLEAAIKSAVNAGIVVVAAAGNTGSEVLIEPAAAPGALAVSAVDDAGDMVWWSSFGDWIGLAAPGVDILTTSLAPGPVASFATVSGTSFAAPFVAGVAALVKDHMPHARGERVAYELIRTANDRGTPGYDRAYGFGIVDAAAAVGAMPRQGVATTTPATGDPDGAPADAHLVLSAATAGTISPVLDEDWYAFDVPTDGRVKLTVTPANGFVATETANLDPLLELYDANDQLLATADETGQGAAETVGANVTVGRVKLRVRNYSPSESREGYTVGVTSGGPVVSAGWSDPMTTSTGGAWANSIVVTEATGDNRPDVVLVDGGGDYKLWVFPQLPGGALDTPTKLATHGTYSGVGGLTTGDFDGDGDTDVALGTASGVDVAYRGPGGLAAPVLVSATAVNLIDGANLDGAGADEIVTVGTSISVLTRSDAGSFNSTPVAATVPQDIEVGDVTGDGKPDVVGVSGVAIQVYAQGSAGTWPLTTYDVSAVSGVWALSGIALGELTGDALKDVAATVGANSPNSHVLVLAQRNDGTLGAPVEHGSDDIPDAAVAGDLDGDGDDDLVVLHRDVAGVYTHGSGGLASESLLTIPYGSYHKAGVALGDIDGDGLGDIAIANRERGLVVIRHATGVTPSQPGVVVRDTTPTTWARDISPTIHPTVVLGGSVNASTVTAETVALIEARSDVGVPATVSYNAATGTATITPKRALPPSMTFVVRIYGVEGVAGAQVYRDAQSFVTASGPHVVTSLGGNYTTVPGDFDGNGSTDVFWYSGTGTDGIFFSYPVGFYGGTYDSGFPGGLRPIAGDFNGDGIDDLFIYSPDSRDDYVLLSTPTDFTYLDVSNVSGSFTPLAGDFNGDGYDDVVWYTSAAGGDAIWFGGPWTLSSAHGKQLSISGSYRPTVGDYDGDGDDDIFWYGAGSKGDGMWTGGPSGFGGMSFVAGGNFMPITSDIDGNGYDDIVWYAAGSPADSSWMFRSGLKYTQTPRSAAGTWRPFAGDFDGDGYGDVVWYGPGAAKDGYWYGSPTGPVN
jgi:subtilisin family serine protease